ncbi:hypothetical protein [Brevibacterium zhoupengii]|uniref:hypothetical protein n=1 Tax=Brevibacterium zhoupengii TaxID=2898795 RepID=UPI001E5D019E|nr:hypothetical protein [Brevibacterium zhoupengii]
MNNVSPHILSVQWEQRAKRSPEQVAFDDVVESVELPAALEPPDDPRPWVRKGYTSAAGLYDQIVRSGSEGVELRNLGTFHGKDRRKDAIEILRGCSEVRETKEQREGTNRRLIVFRATPEVVAKVDEVRAALKNASPEAAEKDDMFSAEFKKAVEELTKAAEKS